MENLFNKKFRFRNFQVYKDSREFGKKLKKLTRERFPKIEQFCLLSQVWRALDSIILNIAEGSDRGTDKDFAHFLNLSHTSLNEVVSCLDVSLDNNYISKEEHEVYLKEAAILSDQLTAFRMKLIKNPTK
jgi:four helix bundle protein